MAATQHAFGTGPHGQHGAPGTSIPQPASGPQSSAHGSYRSQSEEPHHHPHPVQQPHPRPYFFVQPSQPYYPYQWPMPMPYNPYCGLPGLGGYGMVMPPFPPSPYMEAPGYIVPHAQLHLADYRRMVNPHFPPTVAYHARRFRYQQNGAPRETVNSEVQTEPPTPSRSESRDSDPRPADDRQAGSDSGRGSSCTNASSPSQNPSCDEPERENPEAAPPPAPPRPVAPERGYVCESEEVRIECEASPSGLKIIRSRETTAESASVGPAAPGGDLVRCDVWSVSSAEGVIPLYRSSVHEADAASRDRSRPAPAERCAPAFPDILLMGGSPSRGEGLPPLRGGEAPAEPPASDSAGEAAAAPACGPVSLGEAERDRRGADCTLDPEQNVLFKILRLPFELQYLDDLRKLEESVWSVESLMPYVPSADWMIQNGLAQPEKDALEIPMETSASPPRKLAEAVPALETSLAVVQGGGQRESVSSVDSLPPYLPSGSWLADFGNVYYYSKLPLSVQEHLSIVGTPADQLVARKKAEKKPSVRRAVAALAAPDKREEKPRRPQRPERRERAKATLVPSDEGPQDCASCSTKRSVPASHKPTASNPTAKRHRAAPVRAPSPTHVACDGCRGKRSARKGRSPEVPSRTAEDQAEDEAVENRAKPPGGRAGRAADGRKPPPPSGRHSETCSAAQCSKLREQNCSCEEPQRGPAWETQWRGHADAARESGEASAPAMPAAEKFRTAEQRYLPQKLQTERSWRGTMAVHDSESCENASRQRNGNKPKKVSARTQERQHGKTSIKTVIQWPQNPDFVEPFEGYYTRSNWTKGMHRRDTRY